LGRRRGARAGRVSRGTRGRVSGLRRHRLAVRRRAVCRLWCPAGAGAHRMAALLDADVVGSLAVQVQQAASAGTPLTKTAAETRLRAAGLSRADARRVLKAGGHGSWTEVQGPPSSRGGRPPRLLLPRSPGEVVVEP